MLEPAADLLGIDRRQLGARLRRFGLQKEADRVKAEFGRDALVKARASANEAARYREITRITKKMNRWQFGNYVLF